MEIEINNNTNSHHTRTTKSQMFNYQDKDAKEEIESTLQSAFEKMKFLVDGFSVQEFNSTLVTEVSKSIETHNELVSGLLYSILTGTRFPLKQHETLHDFHVTCFQCLNMIARDNFAFFRGLLKDIIRRYPKLTEYTQVQLFWLFDKMCELNITDTESLVALVMRQISVGDISQPNMALIRNVINLLDSQKEWLFSQVTLIPLALWNLLRLIADHTRAIFGNLREKEIEIATSLIRNKWNECAVIGRDLIRLLQDVAKIPEFTAIWQDLRAGTTPFGSGTTVAQLLQTRTPHIYAQQSITLEMENWVTFLLKNVRMGTEKRHLQWFKAKFLATPESETLICDLIRFICCCIHPSNAILSTDIIPRYVFIGFLLRSVKTGAIASNAKLALFYDWLFFNLKKDNIMNIEPGILLMVNSVPKYPSLTAQLVEFLIRLVDLYSPEHKELLRQGVRNSLQILLSKGVVPSIQPILTCPLLPPALLEDIKTTFGPQFGPKGSSSSRDQGQQPQQQQQNQPSQQQAQQAQPQPSQQQPPQPPPNQHGASVGSGQGAAKGTLSPTQQRRISKDLTNSAAATDPNAAQKGPQDHQGVPAPADDEMQLEPFPAVGLEKKDDELKGMGSNTPRGDISADLLTSVPTSLRPLWKAFTKNPSKIYLKELLDSLEDFDDFSFYATNIISILSNELDKSKLDADKNNSPIHWAIFDYLHRKDQTQAVMILEHLKKLNSTFIVRYLLYLVFSVADGTLAAASPNCLDIFKKYFQQDQDFFLPDLRTLNEERVTLFFKVLPFLYKFMPEATVGNLDLLYLVISSIDSSQVLSLSSQLIMKQYDMFPNKQQTEWLQTTFEWDTFEQMCLWQLLIAQLSCEPTFLTESLPELLQILDPMTHGEPLSQILLCLRNMQPSDELVQMIKLLPSEKYSIFSQPILWTWKQKFPNLNIKLDSNSIDPSLK